MLERATCNTKEHVVHHPTLQLHAGAAGTSDSVQAKSPSFACSDEDLLVRYAQHGSCEAFEELVHRYERELFSYLRKYLHRADLAEDAFQTVFLQVHLKCREFDPQRRFRPWLYRIATNRAIDLLRKNRRWGAVRLGLAGRVRTSGEEGQPGENIADPRSVVPTHRLEAAEDIEQVRVLAESLPDRLREVVVLVVLQGLPYQKAADMLRIPLGTVKSRLHEGMSHLRKSVVAAA